MNLEKNRVLVAANYLPYTVKYFDAPKPPPLQLKSHFLNSPASFYVDSPLLDCQDLACHSDKSDRRKSIDRMSETLLGIQEDDAFLGGHSQDFNTPISSPSIRHPTTVSDGMSNMSSSVSSFDSFLISDIIELDGHSKWKIVPYNGGNSGLTNAINATDKLDQKQIWIGTLAGEFPPDALERQEVLERLRRDYGCHAIEGQFEGHLKFCKKIMWPIFHNLLPDQQLALQATSNQSEWKAFVQTNQSFANEIIKIYQPGDIIWINDYHLMLVPQMLRTALPSASIGFFLHVPFPTSEIFRCLPVRQEILEGILASDLIGFQTYGYVRHFFQCCTRILGFACSPRGVQLEWRVVSVGIFPIGIDPARIEKKLNSFDIKEMTGNILERFQGKKIIVARDKVDPVKGIRQKIFGFMQFLRDNPKWRGKVVLLQLAAAGHGKYLQSVTDLADKVNSRFGSLDYSPVIMATQDVSFEQYLALLSAADLCLITSLRDGMNLTSHEFILCQQKKFGPAIISEFAGTSSTFGSALRVNPWDPTDVSDAILKALEMDELEKRERHGRSLRHIRSNTAQVWAESFLDALVSQSILDRQRHSQVAPLIDQNFFCKDFCEAEGSKRLLILDYDALIPGFKNIAYSLQLIRELKACLAMLSDPSRGNIITLISERSAEQMDHTLSGIENIVLCAEDGYCIKYPGFTEWQRCVSDPDHSWWERVQNILEYYTERTPGSWFEKKSAACVWHYEQADPIFGERQAKECQAHIQDTIGTNFPVHAVARNKRLQIRLRSVGQRQAFSSVIKMVLANEPNAISFIGMFFKSREDEGFYSFCKEVIGRSLGLLPSGSPSGLSPSGSNGSVKSAVSYEADRPIYVCAIGDTNTAEADQRVANPTTLLQLLMTAHKQTVQ